MKTITHSHGIIEIPGRQKPFRVSLYGHVGAKHFETLAEAIKAVLGADLQRIIDVADNERLKRVKIEINVHRMI